MGITKAEQKTAYQFMDKNLDDGNYYYRLKTVDNDGSYTYSPIASLSIKSGQSVIIHNNPAQDVLVVQSNDALVERSIELYTIEGKLIEKKTAQQGVTMMIFDVQTLYSGTYLVRVSNGQTYKTAKVVVSR